MAVLGIQCLFLLLLNTQCFAGSEKILNRAFGWFQTPNYPREYDHNLNSTWKIQVRPGYRIKLQFTWFDLEDSFDAKRGGACVYDYVTISEGERTLGRYCGSSNLRAYDAPRLRRWIYTEHENATIYFVSDFSNGELHPTGFKAHYVQIDIDECAVLARKQRTFLEDWDKLLTCNHFCHNVAGSYYCTCRYGFTLHENKHTCVATFCENQNLTGETGAIQSPDYPRNYAKLSHCSWTIKVDAGLSIHIAFNHDFAIESHVVEGCVYDTLTLAYKNQTDTYCGEFGGKWAPNGSPMDMQTNELTVQLDTDLALEMKGFRLTYNTTKIRCLTEIAAPQNGSIVSDLSKGYHEFRDVVQFSCDRGYDLTGAENISCLNNGTWDYDPPVCRIKSCGPPTELLSVDNSHIVDYNVTETTYLAEVVVACNKWYDMVGGTANWICEHEKKWIQNGTVTSPTEGNLPLCKPICGLKGKSKSIIQVQISGGSAARKHQFPWMVLLTYDVGDIDSTRLCGASIISSRYVLTAAHCLNHPNENNAIVKPDNVHVWISVHDRRYPDDSGAQKRNVSEVIRHPRYNVASLWDADFALLRLSSSLVMTDSYRPICLPSKSGDFKLAADDKWGYVAGWGAFDISRRSSSPLQYAEFPIVDNETCWEAYNSSSSNNGEEGVTVKLTENMFCAGMLSNSGTCGGDSGGPFMMESKVNKKTKYYQVGLVSFGISRCGTDFLYTNYAKLNPDIVNWIMNKTNNLE